MNMEGGTTDEGDGKVFVKYPAMVATYDYRCLKMCRK